MKTVRLTTFVFISAIVIVLAVMACTTDKDDSLKPKNGFVPDEATAIRIAEAIWLPIYGKETIDREKPFKATLADGVWTVTGSLPEGRRGGVAIAEISKKDARILRVIHEK